MAGLTVTPVILGDLWADQPVSLDAPACRKALLVLHPGRGQSPACDSSCREEIGKLTLLGPRGQGREQRTVLIAQSVCSGLLGTRSPSVSFSLSRRMGWLPKIPSDQPSTVMFNYPPVSESRFRSSLSVERFRLCALMKCCQTQSLS